MWSIFCTIKRSWAQHFVEQFSAFLILTISYSALLLVALALTNVQNLFEMWGQVNQVTVYTKNDISPESKKELSEALRVHAMVSSLREVTSQESAKNFEERFAKSTSQKIDSTQIAQFFPSYFILNLDHQKAYKGQLGQLDQFVAELKTTFSTIKDVSYGKSWLQRYIGVLSAIQWIGWFLIVVFLIASVIVSSSVIKTILYSRRDEIEILEFIGADDTSIYLPQILNVILLAFTSYILALGFNFLLFKQALSTPDTILSASAKIQLGFVSPWILLGLGGLAIFSVTLYSITTVFNLLPRRKKALLIKGVVH